MIQRVPWDEFKRAFRWRQGEHVTAVAPTGAGKTTLFSELMPYRKWNIMLGTKPDDDTYRKILRNGFKRIERITEATPTHTNYLLWPHQRPTIRETMAVQRAVFLEAMDTIVNQRSWTVWVDESKYMAQNLGLNRELTYCLEQLRSINATVISGAQRPAFLPLSALSSATHIFLWKSLLRQDAQRLADIGGIDVKELTEELKSLGKFEFVYVKTRGTEASMKRTEVEGVK